MYFLLLLVPGAHCHGNMVLPSSWLDPGGQIGMRPQLQCQAVFSACMWFTNFTNIPGPPRYCTLHCKCTLLYITALQMQCTSLFYAVLYCSCTVHHYNCTALHCHVLHCTILHCKFTALHCTVLWVYSTALYFSIGELIPQPCTCPMDLPQAVPLAG